MYSGKKKKEEEENEEITEVKASLSLDIWNFLVHVMLKPSMQDFKQDLTSMGDECDCPMLSTFFGTTLLGNWDKE